ncbi:hypothetical protein GTA08_BOTSDO10347 [Neofusicoccum parvum]|uniref:Uncharacterized protein n=2 Tax=Neofusicoccum parvum TaxID=310453 RepID=R1GMP4_BOTPV|nr:hypothetical protein UCRNP2_5985 [Neofusicoccum parvum UCRNP2]GME23838.1 hypothetical protein GTA08_BOTSDO10347 [Neofusicoccum parvum]GME42270.1 hypothetical protein GTA08_BOTSDO10347 [Neofusicoccum parvum]
MPLPRALIITSLITVPPAYYVYTTINQLEAKYPRLHSEAASTVALRTPSFPVTHHTPHVDVYGGTVPVKVLQEQHGPDGRKLSLEEAWAKVFMQSPILRLEGRLFGGFSSSPGDIGDHGFHAKQKLLNGGLEVVRPPTEPSALFLRSLSQPTPLLVKWTFPVQAVAFVRKAAIDWGYPWRFMSGGRHEFSVGQANRNGMVEVRFGTAHDYEYIKDEGNNQKTIPQWTARLHRAYAMWLLDERIEALKKAAADAEPQDSKSS